MKKVFLLLVFAMSLSFISCETEDINDDQQIQQTDKDKVCPPNDRDCDPNTPQ